MRIILALSLLLTGNLLFGQLSNEILLKSLTQLPGENIEEYIETAQLGKQDIVNGRYYKILQFNSILSGAEIKTLENTGIRLLDYIPNKAYLVSIPQELDPSLLRSVKARQILPLNMSYKIDEKLQEADLPEWAKVGDDLVEVKIHYPADLAQEEVLLLSRFEKITPIEYNGVNTCFTATVPIANIENLSELPYILQVELRSPPATPDDTPGRSIVRANMIDSPAPMGRKYDGSGVAVLCRDDGEVFDHVDFHGRLFQEFVGGDRGNHGDGVSGIMSGAGNKNPRHRGMAAGSDLYVVDYASNFLDETLSLHRNQNVLVTNSSYSDGCNAGYTGSSRTVDRQCYDNPTLMHVFSAGNSNGENCGYGAGSQWGNITGGHKQGKNVITTANITNVGNITDSSSRGPAYDGRIKPDISSNGINHVSTDDNHTYQAFGGTSAAAPGIAGILAMLHHAYRTNNDEEIAEGALLKAIMLNTADDLGNKGPDFIYGWGAANAYRAALTIENKTYEKGSISQNENKEQTITIPEGARELRIMTYWSDPAAAVGVSKALINDINTSVVGPDGVEHLPWKLASNPIVEILELPATKGVDNLNNMEQVFIDNPAGGDYTLNLFGDIIPIGAHDYIVTWEYRLDDVTIVYPFGGEKLVPSGSEIINWEAGTNGSSFELEFSSDGGDSWTEFARPSARSRTTGFNAPNIITNQAHIKIKRDGTEVISDAFIIAPTPGNVEILEVCAGNMVISWNGIPEATSYDIYTLGNKYMEVVATSTVTTAEVPISSPYEPQWVAVAANFEGGIKGQRSIAEQHDGSGLINCLLEFDAILSNVSNPTDDHFITCSGSVDEFITVELINSGLNALSNVNLSYQLGSNPTVTEPLGSALGVGDTINYTFVQPLNLVANGDFELKTWLSQDEQDLKINDTINISGPVYLENGTSFPLEENFTNRTFPDFWRVENPDNSVTWTQLRATQRNGSFNGTLTLPFEDYARPNNIDYLNLIPVDFSNVTETTKLSFDIAYFYNNMQDDGLLIEVSTDCGATFQDTIYEKYGEELATTFKYFKSPESSAAWSQEEIDVSQYNGFSKVLFRLVGVNQSGSNLYLDNISITESALAQPSVSLAASGFEFCPLTPVIVEEEADGCLLDYNWDFGFSSFPNTSDKAGPHEVQYLLPGPKTITLIVTNAVGSDTITHTVDIISEPSGGWSHELLGWGNVQFTTNIADANYRWDFGDGNSSREAMPLHMYETTGEYEVKLFVENDCGSNTLTGKINVIVSDVNELEEKLTASIAPNPNTGVFSLLLEGAIGTDLEMKVINLSGQKVDHKTIRLSGTTTKYNYTNDQLTPGIYYLELNNELGRKVLKMLVMER